MNPQPAGVVAEHLLPLAFPEPSVYIVVCWVKGVGAVGVGCVSRSVLLTGHHGGGTGPFRG